MQYWHRRLHRSVTDRRRLRSGRPHWSRLTRRFYPLGLAAHAQIQVPAEGAGALGRTPGRLQVAPDEPQRVAAEGRLVALRGRPGLQITDHGRQVPEFL